jgi:hypothetical protein
VVGDGVVLPFGQGVGFDEGVSVPGTVTGIVGSVLSTGDSVVVGSRVGAMSPSSGVIEGVGVG